MWNTSTSEDKCKYAWKYRMKMLIEFKYKMDTSIYLKYDALVSVLFLSLLPCLVLWKPNDNPIQFTGNNMLQNNKKDYWTCQQYYCGWIKLSNSSTTSYFRHGKRVKSWNSEIYHTFDIWIQSYEYRNWIRLCLNLYCFILNHMIK